MEGMVFDIQRYSIHDGPGIRTTIFLKGCALRCKWCSNPESQNPYPEIFVRNVRCNRCGKCLDVCPLGTITLDKGGIHIDRAKCNLCMKCVDVCHPGAISRVGENKDVEEVIQEASKDELFYRNSGGGVTISGGEPLYQEEFTLNLLKECKAKGLHTAIDTCGYGKWEALDKILEYTDLVLFDIKHLDPEMHRKGTGVQNKLILKNLERIAKRGKRIWIRIPVIPGYNSQESCIRNEAELAATIAAEKVSLLGYHEWGRSKYEALGVDYPLKDVEPMTEDQLEDLKGIVESYGLRVTLNY